MKYSTSTFVTLFLMVLFISSCDIFNSQSSQYTKFEGKTSEFYYYEIENDTLGKAFGIKDGEINMGKYYAVSKKNEGAANLEKEQLPETKILNVEIYVDKELSQLGSFYETGSIHENLINHILKKLNFGYSIKVISTKPFESYAINTDGKVNQNTIYKSLPFDNEYYWHVYLFDRSDFFNTANAVCLKDGEHSFIMGDGNLLQSPLLFIHELGHALGLSHSNTEYKPDTKKNNLFKNDFYSFFNVMHESNIGCSRYLSHRQFLLTHSNEFVEPLIGQDSSKFETICGCNKTYLDNNFERYINSFDRNIDDTPIVGDAASLINMYRNELLNGIIDGDIIMNLSSNFEKEWDVLIADPGIISKNVYLDKRIENHKKLRKNNIARWLRENQKLQGTLDTSSYFKQPRKFYVERFQEVSNYCCYDIHNEILDILSLIEKLETKIDNSIVFENEQPDSTWYKCLTKILEYDEEQPRPNTGISFNNGVSKQDLKNKLKNLLLKNLQ